LQQQANYSLHYSPKKGGIPAEWRGELFHCHFSDNASNGWLRQKSNDMKLGVVELVNQVLKPQKSWDWCHKQH
jgi:hypothetical protein